MSDKQKSITDSNLTDSKPLLLHRRPDSLRIITKRLITQFVGQFAIVGFIALVLMAVALFFMLIRMSQLDMNRSFTSSGLQLLVDSLEIKSGQITFDPKLLTEVKESGGWLQTLDERGNVTSSHYTPVDVPNHYNAGELAAIWSRKQPFPYSLYIWIESKDGVDYTLLYGTQDTGHLLAQKAAESALITDRTIQLPNNLEHEIRESGGWLQLLDGDMKELASLGKSEGAPSSYSLQDFILRSEYADRYAAKLSSFFDERTAQTWVLHMPLPASSHKGLFGSIQSVMIFGFAGLLAVVLLVFIILAFVYAHRFGTPILHMMDWLQHLANDDYKEPTDRKGRPRSIHKDQKLKRRYRLFTEIFTSLSRLSDTLKRNEDMRIRLERTREEWIAGVTHDLKTPLSSIVGYAHMLEADDYEWTREEVREFAAIMKEKASYMDAMIGDLSITYRLKNEAQPLSFERVEMNAFIERAIIRLLQDPRLSAANVALTRMDQELYYPIDPGWFNRIIDNIVANAVLHNPPGTAVRISLSTQDDQGFVILVSDNGQGMDEATAELLFERYFRGTNTEENDQGTGLGLAIAKQLVLAHGGTIEVQSAYGAGTVIRMAFPPK
ncbi:sensor histidine kinase KdpD [Paenibacillus sp. FSL H7-0331]|uniref:sensor histidine kinase n=1 Tax=Paenibacillus sp. FSL H7-0331 TaxID=1920421 RepID=UPI0009F889C8|nr:HAMP domain-containing sensor histidine kinase [Paenibacillus sp. FSL H7-0331]